MNLIHKRQTLYLLLFCFCTWLALTTRQHKEWFHPLVVEYGGDIIWSGMFLFFLRIFFCKMPVWKLSIICYLLGVVDEVSQLYHAKCFESIRSTRMGRLMLGVGFLWSDIICYAIGVLLAFFIVLLIELFIIPNKSSSVYKTK